MEAVDRSCETRLIFVDLTEDFMPDTTFTNEMKKLPVSMSIKAKHSNLEIARSLTVARSFLCKVRKELLNENNGYELAASSKTKELRQRSVDSITHSLTHSLRTHKFMRRVHGMASHGGRKFTQKNRSVFGFSPTKNTSTRMKKSIEKMIGGRLCGWTLLKFQLFCMRMTIPTAVMLFDIVVKASEGHLMTSPLFPQGLRVNADTDAHVETLPIIVVKPPWIDSVDNGERLPCVFQQDSAPSH
ncbi:hypothetical protein ACTXT7_006273 [Hymenolepis weldensis]